MGITSLSRQLPATVSQREIEAAVRELCNDDTVDGVLVQLPLPPHLDEESIIESFDPAKDVDGFHPLNMGRILMRGRAPSFVPCTALGCMELLLRSGVDVRGKTAVILVRPNPKTLYYKIVGPSNTENLAALSHNNRCNGRAWARLAQDE